jgi:uncharacterized membrane protein YoaK (UPF0700 family)
MRMQTSPVPARLSRQPPSYDEKFVSIGRTGGQARRDREPSSAVPVPSIDRSGMMPLPAVLSPIVGICDTIGLIGLGLFTARVTGNLEVLAKRLVAIERTSISHVLSVPVFVAALVLTRVLAGDPERLGIASLRRLLLLQVIILLSGLFFLCITAGPLVDSNTGKALLAGILSVSAMAVQNALAQISVRGTPSTAVMTPNIARIVMDLGANLFDRNPDHAAAAAMHITPQSPALQCAAERRRGARLLQAYGPRYSQSAWRWSQWQ